MTTWKEAYELYKQDLALAKNRKELKDLINSSNEQLIRRAVTRLTTGRIGKAN